MPPSPHEGPARKFKGVWIPARFWDDPDLTLLKRHLLAEVDSLSDEKEGCWASNDHFATRFKVSTSQISRAINELVAAGYLSSEIVPDKGALGGRRRYLWIAADPLRKTPRGSSQYAETASAKCLDPSGGMQRPSPQNAETSTHDLGTPHEAVIEAVNIHGQQQQKAAPAAAPVVILEPVSGPDRGVLPDAAAADMEKEPTERAPTEPLPIAVPPPQASLPSQAIEAYDAGAELLRRQGIAIAKAQALSVGRSLDELREWIRIAKDKRHPTGFLVAMLSANEPLPAEAEQRLKERDRLETHQRRAQEQEQVQAAEPVPDLAQLFPEYRHRVVRWRDYTPQSASPGPTVPSPSPELAAMQSHSARSGAVYTRESCHNANR